MSTMHRLPAVFVLLLMAANWSSFLLVADARTEHEVGASCIPRERDALLAFKQGISHDPEDYLGSWQQGRQDCCRWAGIHCSNTTGHVIQLDISGTYLEGQISPSLLSLEHLEYLNLNYTALAGPDGGVPEFLGSFPNLTHLDLSNMGFTGEVPPQLGNISKLEYLDLSNSWMHPRDISWLSRLPLLVYLDMSYMNLSSIAADWPLVVNMIPALEYLRLPGCSLSSADRSLTHFNLTNLQYLDLSYNYLGHTIASGWFWNATNIKYLNLSATSMHGPFPNALEHMTSLRELRFENSTGIGNKATMTLDLNNLCDLQLLWLGGSLSYGNITKFLEKLPQCRSNMLQELRLNNNNMVGVLPNSLGHLSGLLELDLSNNNITGPIPLGIRSCTSLEVLYLYNNSLSGHVPSKIGMLNNLIILDLSSNNLGGMISAELLITLKNLKQLHLSQNTFSGPLPLEFGAKGLQLLDLSFNYFDGHVPESICQLGDLNVLDLSNNFITGELPHCSNMSKLLFLFLSNSSFSGKFPPSLRNSSNLAFLDLSRNNFHGTLPLWIGDFKLLNFLQLSHNFLYGDIPVTITNLTQLRHLSLAGNNMSGVIPWSFSNLTAMAQQTPNDGVYEIYTAFLGSFREVLPIVLKHQELKYGSGIFEVVGIDLSLNQLIGGIPDEITSLKGLLYLNLSWNQLSGKIPTRIGSMKSIESLDFSRNNLSGKIPSSLSDLTYLSSLDLSYNNLEGRIPPGSQLDTLYMENPSIYNGNTGLCGPPLKRNCSGDNAPKHVNQQRSEKVSEPVLFFYFGLGSGFLTGLWIVFCTLLFKKAWRVAFFRLFDKVHHKAYVFVVVTWGRINSSTTS